MGYAISWLAIRGNTKSPVLASLGLEKTGGTEEHSRSKWSTTSLGDWVVIWSNSYEPSDSAVQDRSSTGKSSSAMLRNTLCLCR